MTTQDIVILCDFEEGHLFPTFHLARELSSSGYKVAYWGIADQGVHVRNQGFDFFPIYEDVYPLGKIVRLKKEQRGNDVYENPVHLLKIEAGELDGMVEKYRPRLFMFSSFLMLEALIMHYKYHIPSIVFTPHLQRIGKPSTVSEKCFRQILKLTGLVAERLLNFVSRQVKFRSLSDVVAPLNNMPEVVLCPGEFDIAGPSQSNSIFLGPCVRTNTRSAKEAGLKYLPGSKRSKLIYASLGSQVYLYPNEARKVIETLIACLSSPGMDDYKLVVSLGGFFDEDQFGALPDFIRLQKWVPQVEILSHASIAVCHGGLGSIKELICYGVPMIIIPFGRDQLDNAMRVKHHGIGLTESLDTLEITRLKEMIHRLESDEKMKQSLHAMQSVFLAKDKAGILTRVVERQLADIPFVPLLE